SLQEFCITYYQGLYTGPTFGPITNQ
ncbi:hypothetical protein DBR06_SOUSAS37510003, partial [Sousa chinensis]